MVDRHKLRDFCEDVGVSHLQVVEVLRRVGAFVRENDGEVITKTVGTFYLQKRKARQRTLNGIVYDVPPREVVQLRGPKFPGREFFTLIIANVRSGPSTENLLTLDFDPATGTAQGQFTHFGTNGGGESPAPRLVDISAAVTFEDEFTNVLNTGEVFFEFNIIYPEEPNYGFSMPTSDGQQLFIGAGSTGPIDINTIRDGTFNRATFNVSGEFRVEIRLNEVFLDTQGDEP